MDEEEGWMDMQGVTTYYSVINYWMMEEFIITVTRLLKSNPTIKGTIVLSIAILRHIFFLFLTVYNNCGYKHLFQMQKKLTWRVQDLIRRDCDIMLVYKTTFPKYMFRSRNFPFVMWTCFNHSERTRLFQGTKREIFSSDEQTVEKRMQSSINLARFLSIKAS